ncbi:MAG: response regulator [Planctomycetes bacterium]|nr:response regulator [Planctomycetota bacterium]
MPELSNADTAVRTQDPIFASAVPGDRSINILLVDDDPRNLSVLETVLNDPEYRLIQATSADQALLALVREEFALIVLDIRMPGMTGFELAQMIKHRKKTAGVPIIFLTAYYSEAEHVIEGYGVGAVDYLNKPVNPAILRSKVAVFASLHRTKRDTERANNLLREEVAERRRIEEQLLQLNNKLEQRVEQRTAELLAADRRKNEFLATLAHELRNPLAPIRNGLEILTLTGVDSDAARVLTAMMDRQVKHLVRLVDDLLDVSRVMGGRIELRKEQIDVASVVAVAVEMVQPVIQEQRHQLQIFLPTEPMIVDADPVRLNQVIGNLLANAAKYTVAGGRITLTGEREGNELILRIRDNGIGIGPDMLSRIFDLFVQVDQSSTRAQGGLGIGLTLVKTLVELHGGAVSAASEGLGQGSEFVVRLPMATPSKLRKRDEDDDRPLLNGSGHRLLVVDDNKSAAVTLAMLLRLKGYEARVAHDGLTALKLAAEYHPQMIFLDIGMPKMDGCEVARQIRENPELKNVRLVAVTGWGQHEDMRRTMEAGFDHHLTKPTDMKDLEVLLSELNRAMA